MASKQDVLRSRTPEDLERKYNFAKRFAELEALKKAAEEAKLLDTPTAYTMSLRGEHNYVPLLGFEFEGEPKVLVADYYNRSEWKLVVVDGTMDDF